MALKSLYDWNAEILARPKPEPVPNGIACPKCGEELVDVGSIHPLSNPPQKQIYCPGCGYCCRRFV